MDAHLFITFDAHEFVALGDGLMASPKVVAEEAKRAMERSAITVQNAAKLNLQRQGAIDTGQLLNSIAREVQPFEARIGSNKQYARLVEGADEEGRLHEWSRRPGMPPPPPGSLLGWMNRHNIPEELETTIRFSIARKGIKARPYLIPALEQNRAQIDREFAAAQKRIVKRTMQP